ncbi:RsmD family RNA methyltransferase [Paludibacter sp.]
MRIISGKYKGRRIPASNKVTARPTTDFAKEGLFNLLNNRIDFEDISVLDLFAGTGSIGFEFISRGCKDIFAIEQDDNQLNYMKKVCKELQITNHYHLKADVFKYITSCHSEFDIIFADPPYDLKNIEEIPTLIFNRKILKADGLFILEHSAKQQFNEHPNFSFHRKYGNVNFSFFELK